MLQLQHRSVLLACVLFALLASVESIRNDVGVSGKGIEIKMGQQADMESIRKKGKTSQRAQTKCCCRGQRPETSRQLTKDQLTASRNPFRSGKLYCPGKLGWHKPPYFGIEHYPETCSEEPEEDVKEITVKAYWMRHGWSCSNAMQAQGKQKGYGWMSSFRAMLQSWKFPTYSDPSLTDAAIERAKVLRDPIRRRILNETAGHAPLLFTSFMVRAVETALYNFLDWDVRPIPYIAETGSMPDNTPQAWSDQEKGKFDRSPNTDAMRKHIKFDVNPADHPDRSSSRKSSYRQFKRYLPAILDELLESQEQELEQGAEVPVIIISHSGYMKRFLDCTAPGNGKPRNNEVWVQKYKVKLGAYDAVLEHAGCEKLFDREYYPEAPKALCARDVDRCGMKPTYWIEKDEEKCTGNTSIVERDREEGLRYASER